jgi:uncharacterized protein (TIGR00255 family)
MIRSMTGFASRSHEDAHGSVTVTIRALNHRHLDLQVRMPASLSAVEARLRAAVQRHIGRGRIELSVTCQAAQAPGVEVEFNREFGAALTAALDAARGEGLVSGPLTPGDLLRLPQALTIRERRTDDEAQAIALGEAVADTVEQALVDLNVMRAREGDQLRGDLDSRRRQVAEMVERIAVAAQEGEAGVRARLAERVRELAADLGADAALVAQEIVKTAARSDISEEVERFRGHVRHWGELADGAEACGRKLDFLLQEMNREVNTMGSKADGLKVSEVIIAAKAELEKMREQVQNVE